MDNIFLLISGFIGAIIGGGASIITIIVQNNALTKREHNRLASTLALEEYKIAMEFAKNNTGNYSIYPIVSYVHYYSKLIKLLDSGKMDKEEIIKLYKENKAINEAIENENI